jgi:hypothetical protein
VLMLPAKRRLRRRCSDWARARRPRSPTPTTRRSWSC